MQESMNNLCDLCMKDASKCGCVPTPCSYVPKYNLCPICNERVIVYASRCYKCGYDFKANSEDKE